MRKQADTSELLVSVRLLGCPYDVVVSVAGVGPTCRPDPSFTCFPAVDGLSFPLIGTASLSLDRRLRDHFDRADIIARALRAEDAVIVRRQSHTESGRIHTGVDGG